MQRPSFCPLPDLPTLDILRSPQPRDRLGPTEEFLDNLASSLTHGVPVIRVHGVREKRANIVAFAYKARLRIRRASMRRVAAAFAFEIDTLVPALASLCPAWRRRVIVGAVRRAISSAVFARNLLQTLE